MLLGSLKSLEVVVDEDEAGEGYPISVTVQLGLELGRGRIQPTYMSYF